jgi:hypothetical protein
MAENNYLQEPSILINSSQIPHSPQRSGRSKRNINNSSFNDSALHIIQNQSIVENQKNSQL